MGYECWSSNCPACGAPEMREQEPSPILTESQTANLYVGGYCDGTDVRDYYEPITDET